MRTYGVTGAASGIGAATTALLRSQAHRVLTVGLVGPGIDVLADLSSAPGRSAAVGGGVPGRCHRRLRAVRGPRRGDTDALLHPLEPAGSPVSGRRSSP